MVITLSDFCFIFFFSFHFLFSYFVVFFCSNIPFFSPSNSDLCSFLVHFLGIEIFVVPFCSHSNIENLWLISEYFEIPNWKWKRTKKKIENLSLGQKFSRTPSKYLIWWVLEIFNLSLQSIWLKWVFEL